MKVVIANVLIILTNISVLTSRHLRDEISLMAAFLMGVATVLLIIATQEFLEARDAERQPQYLSNNTPRLVRRSRERNQMTRPSLDGFKALARLCAIAGRDTGQSRRVADSLLARHNAEENKKLDPTDLWVVDTAIAEDMLVVLQILRAHHGKYPKRSRL